MLRFCSLIALGLGLASPAIAAEEKAIVAGGCFWCVEADFEKVPGVAGAVSGYTGGTTENPTYNEVGRGGTGHFEAVEITFDTAQITYDEVLSLFLRSVDVTDAEGQFCDRGESYRTAIFPLNAAQRAVADAAVAKASADLGAPIVTPVLDATTFWPAEDYHQDYYKGTNIIITRAGPKRQSSAYDFYRTSCGRDERVKEVWGSAAALVK